MDDMVDDVYIRVVTDVPRSRAAKRRRSLPRGVKRGPGSRRSPPEGRVEFVLQSHEVQGCNVWSGNRFSGQ